MTKDPMQKKINAKKYSGGRAGLIQGPSLTPKQHQLRNTQGYSRKPKVGSRPKIPIPHTKKCYAKISAVQKTTEIVASWSDPGPTSNQLQLCMAQDSLQNNCNAQCETNRNRGLPGLIKGSPQISPWLRRNGLAKDAMQKLASPWARACSIYWLR